MDILANDDVRVTMSETMSQADGISERSSLPLAGNAEDDTSVSMPTTSDMDDDDDSIGVLWQRGLEECTERVEQMVRVEQMENRLAQQQSRRDQMKYSVVFTAVMTGMALGPIGAATLGFAA